MLWYIGAFAVAAALAAILWEIRVRRPDQLVVQDTKGEIRARVGRFYPRHFSLCLPYTAQTIVTEIEAEAKGRLGVRIRLSVSAAPDVKKLAELIRVGGWSRDAVNRACRELELMLHSLVRAYTEQKELEEISSEEMVRSIRSQLNAEAAKLGLQVLSVNVRSVEPSDAEIAELIQQREAARIRKQTEIVNQQARVAASRAKLDADERIARAEHELQLKKLELRRQEEAKEAELAQLRLEQELERRRAQLEMEKREVELLTGNPEVLLLTPQIARLAEASQGLRNARTVVSLSPNTLPEDSPLLKNVSRLLEHVLNRALEKSGKGQLPEKKE